MTPNKVIETLSRLTMPHFLSPTWGLHHTQPHRCDLHNVVLTITTPCRDTGTHIQVSYTNEIMADEDSRMGAEVMVFHEGWAMIQHLVLHEMSEHLLKDNERWRDPHKPRK